MSIKYKKYNKDNLNSFGKERVNMESKKIIKFIQTNLVYLIPIILIPMLFLLIEKKAWIDLKGNPKEVYITNYNGSIFSRIRNIESTNGENLKCTVENNTPILVEINNKTYDLEANQFKVVFDQKNGNMRNSITSSAIMNFDLLNLKSNINIKSNGSEFIEDSNNDIQMDMTIDNDIQDELINLKEKSNKIKFINKLKDGSASTFKLNNISNLVLKTTNKEDEYIALTGTCKQIDGIMKNGNVEFTQNNKEKLYKLDLRENKIKAYKEQYIVLNYQNNINKEKMKANGCVEKYDMWGDSLFLNLSGWLNDNISMIMGAILTTYIGVIISKKK